MDVMDGWITIQINSKKSVLTQAQPSWFQHVLSVTDDKMSHVNVTWTHLNHTCASTRWQTSSKALKKAGVLDGEVLNKKGYEPETVQSGPIRRPRASWTAASPGTLLDAQYLDSLQKRQTTGSNFLMTFNLRGWNPGLWLADNSCLRTLSFFIFVYLLTNI